MLYLVWCDRMNFLSTLSLASVALTCWNWWSWQHTVESCCLMCHSIPLSYDQCVAMTPMKYFITTIIRTNYLIASINLNYNETLYKQEAQRATYHAPEYNVPPLDGLARAAILFFWSVKKAKSRKYQGVFEVKSRVKTWQVRGIWSQQLEH